MTSRPIVVLWPARGYSMNLIAAMVVALAALALVACASAGGANVPTAHDVSAPADAALGDVAVDSTTPAVSPLVQAKFINIAHRGGRLLRPAHTLVAYENALAVGADMIEVDLHASSDGVIVSIHDATVDDTTDGSGKVKEMTWAQLAALDAGYRFTTDGGKTFPWRGKGLRIAHLDEVLAAFPKTWLSAEIKQATPDIVEPVMALFEQHDAVSRTIFSSFSDPVLAAMRARRPDALTALGVSELMVFVTLEPTDLASYKAPAPFAQPPDNLVDAQFVSRAHLFGMKVQPWTVNDAARVKALLALGIDGLFTDDPALLAQWATATAGP